MFIGKDQDWENETTTYWFEYDGDVVGIVEGFDECVVDADGNLLDDDKTVAHIREACKITNQLRMD